MATATRLAAALAAWRRELGAAHVVDDGPALAAAATATYATTSCVPAILRPGSRAEVQACVRIANEHGVPLYPISRGKNWGYGSRVPVADGCVLLDLSRLDRIVAYDERLGYLTVEPGVTFAQAFAFLRAQGSHLLLSVTGGSPDASLIGNAVERGIGAGIYADRASHVCGFEVVLPTGACIRTGFGRFANAAAAHVYRWGTGPAVDGLFTQSNLGIVTAMTFWLQPCPELLQVIFFRVDDDARLDPLVDALQAAALRGLLTPALTVFNDLRFVSVATQYPWREAGGRTPLPDDVRRAMRQASPLGPIGAWNGDLPFFARSADEASVHAALLAQALGPLVDSWTVVEAAQPDLLALLAQPDAPPTAPAGAAPLHAALLKRYLGVPQSLPLRQLYWRKKTPPPADMDPDRDRCGVIWLSPVVPFTSAHVRRAIEIITATTLEAGFEPAITLQCISERAVILIASLHYDRDVPGEDERAAAWHRAATRRLAAAGYYPYRQSTLELAEGQGEADPYVTFLRTLKRALDPQGILAPGRYI
jgi:4-cresol dehydrogenase (hydroxylating)